MAVTTPREFREFIAAHHEAYRAARFDASGSPRRSHGDAVKRLDRLIKVWQGTTALPFARAQKGLHRWAGFRAAQTYVAEFVSLLGRREYEGPARQLESAFRLLGFQVTMRPGQQGWDHTRTYPIGIFHGDVIVIRCLVELYAEAEKCLPRVSLALNRDELARWVRDKRRSAGISPRPPPPAPTPGPRDPAKLREALDLLKQGHKPESVGRRVGVSLATIYRWRKSHGLAGRG